MRKKLLSKGSKLNNREYELNDLEDLICVGEVHHTPWLDANYDKINKINPYRFRNFRFMDLTLDIDSWSV